MSEGYQVYKLLFIFLFITLANTSFSQSVERLEGTITQKYLRIEAVDLAEDYSILSSKNDELLVYIFEKAAHGKVAHCLLSDSTILDTINRVFLVPIPDSLIGKNCMLVLVEQDSEISMHAIGRKLSTNLMKLLKAREKHEEAEIMNILGDDDLLGIYEMNFSATQKFKNTFKGIHLFDTYHYLVELK